MRARNAPLHNMFCLSQTFEMCQFLLFAFLCGVQGTSRVCAWRAVCLSSSFSARCPLSRARHGLQQQHGGRREKPLLQVPCSLSGASRLAPPFWPQYKPRPVVRPPFAVSLFRGHGALKGDPMLNWSAEASKTTPSCWDCDARSSRLFTISDLNLEWCRKLDMLRL